MAETYRETAERSGYVGDAFTETYERFRPRPPVALLELLEQLAGGRPRLVVDLGCGTGLSTRAWAGRAEQVIGVDVNEDMLRRAEAAMREPNVQYRLRPAHDTGIGDAEARIVTASQSLHWMDPEPTLAEVTRILRPGGVFAAYDYDWPPAVHPEIDTAFLAMAERALPEKRRRGFLDHQRADKALHLERMRESGGFRLVRELCVHSVEQGDAERIAGFALTLGPLAKLLQEGLSEEEVGLAELRRVASDVLGDRSARLWFTYRVRLGVR